MSIPYYQVDAFTDRLFAGNPAGVCVLTEWLPDATLQAIAAENNLAETAFVVRRDGQFDLRWFTPNLEMDLCGHATLASAHVIFQHLGCQGSAVRFQTKSGLLTVTCERELLTLDFPARPAIPCPTSCRNLIWIWWRTSFAPPPGGRWRPVSRWWSSTWPTATCCTSSCPPCQTCGVTAMAAALRTGSVSRCGWPGQCVRNGLASCRCLCDCPVLTGQRMAGALTSRSAFAACSGDWGLT